ncbi:unnamed protein product, partial [Laminaria digitata]
LIRVSAGQLDEVNNGGQRQSAFVLGPFHIVFPFRGIPYKGLPASLRSIYTLRGLDASYDSDRARLGQASFNGQGSSTEGLRRSQIRRNIDRALHVARQTPLDPYNTSSGSIAQNQLLA